MLRLEAVKVPDDFGRNVGLLCPFGFGDFRSFLTNQRELAGIKPITRAIRTFVDLDAAFGAKEMAMQLDALTGRTFAFAVRVDHDPRIDLDVHEGLSRGLGFLVDTFQFECVEPNATT